MDLGAGPVRTFFKVTLPAILPAVMAAALLVFALSIDDYVVTSFVAGVGATTLPLQIYSMVKSGVSPGDQRRLDHAAPRHRPAARSGRSCSSRGARRGRPPLPAVVGLAVLGAPFLMAGGPAPARRPRAEPLHLVELHRPRDARAVRGAPRREGQRGPLRLERGAARQAAGRQRRATTSICPSDYSVRGAACAGPAAAARPLGAAPPRATSTRRSSTAPTTPATPTRCPYFWGTSGIAYHRRRVAEPPDSWGALWDPRYAGRILMLDDAREVFGAALKWRGHSLNTRDPRLLEAARDDLLPAEAAGAGLQLLELRGRPALRATSGSRRRGTARSPRRWRRTRTSPTWCPEGGLDALHRQPGDPAGRPQPRARARLHRLHARGRDRRRDLPHHEVLEPEPGGVAAAARRGPQQPGDLPAARRCSTGSS